MLTEGLAPPGSKPPCVGNNLQGSISYDLDNDGIRDPQLAIGPQFSANTTGLLELTVQRVGQGAVSSAPVGIDCNDQATSNCVASFRQGESITLTALASTGWSFNGWSSLDPTTNCNQNGPGTIGLGFSTSCTATFVQDTPTPPVFTSAVFPNSAEWVITFQYTGGTAPFSLWFARTMTGPAIGGIGPGTTEPTVAVPQPWTTSVDCDLQEDAVEWNNVPGQSWWVWVQDALGRLSNRVAVQGMPPVAACE